MFLVPTAARAQSAFVPPRGEVDLSVTYQRIESHRHYFGDAVAGEDLAPVEEFVGTDFDGPVVDLGAIESHGAIVDGDVGLTDRLALFGGVALVQAKYTGSTPDGETDDGTYHGGFQDARVGARYLMVDRGLWVATPFVELSVPTRDYPVAGHAVIGRGLKELRVGAAVGGILVVGGAARGYVEGSYSYGFMENPSDELALNRSRAGVEVGFFLGRLSLQVLSSWQHVHGGLEWANIGDHHLSEEHVHMHDQAAATRDWRMGVGMTFDTSDTTALYLSYNGLVSGVNTHDGHAITFGVNWAFQAFGGFSLGPGGD